MPFQLKARYHSYTELWESWTYAAWGFYLSAKAAFQQGRYRDLFRLRQLQDAGFFWWYKTLNKYHLRFERNMTPLPRLVPSCRGVVLELGPGMGNQLELFDKGKITRVVGVECNPNFIPELQAQITSQNLDGVYDIVMAGVEDLPSDTLKKYGIHPESVDTVLSTGVLCSVPNPEKAMREMYGLLKPGGRFIFWEHHKSEDWLTGIVQGLWNILWRPMVGGCNLNRDIRAIVLQAGKWENLESLEDDGDKKPLHMLPRVWGELVKPGGG